VYPESVGEALVIPNADELDGRFVGLADELVNIPDVEEADTVPDEVCVEIVDDAIVLSEVVTDAEPKQLNGEQYWSKYAFRASLLRFVAFGGGEVAVLWMLEVVAPITPELKLLVGSIRRPPSEEKAFSMMVTLSGLTTELLTFNSSMGCNIV